MLIHVFSLLSSTEQKEARGKIFDKYWEMYPNGRENSEQIGKMLFTFRDEFKPVIRKVTSAFDQAGVLVIKKILESEPDLFFDLYADMVTRTWMVLEEDILTDQMQNREICKWFKEVYDKTQEYYKRKGITPPTIYRKPM